MSARSDGGDLFARPGVVAPKAPFPDHGTAALTLLTAGKALSVKQTQFLGGAAYSDTLSEKQLNWLVALLSKHGLPSLADGGPDA